MKVSSAVALAALNVALLAALGLAWLYGPTDWTPPGPLAPDAALLEPPEPPPVASADDPQLHGRPLFAASRRPAPVAAPPAEEPPAGARVAADPLADATLLGLAGRGDEGAALVALGGEVRRVTVGGLLQGWRLKTIQGPVARFANALGEERTLSMAPAPRGSPEPPARRGAQKARLPETTPPPAAQPASAGGIQTLLGKPRQEPPDAVAPQGRSRSPKAVGG